jgi:hypothetical protein
MGILVIPFAFVLPLVTLVLNIINVRKKGERGIAIALITIILWVLVFFLIAALNLGEMTPLPLAIGMLCVCTSTFLLSRIGGFSAWKTAGAIRIVLVTLTAVPLIFVAGVFSYERYLLDGITNGSTWTQRVQSYNQLHALSNWMTRGLADELLSGIREQCPDLSSFASLSQEDQLLYYSFAYEHDHDLLTQLLSIDSIENEQQLSNVLAFYNTAKRAGEAAYRAEGVGDDLPVHAPLAINPDNTAELAANTYDYRADGDYAIFFYGNDLSGDADWALAPGYMMDYLTDDTVPESADDTDLAIVISSTFSNTGQYSGGSPAFDRRVNVCVYDYTTGELLGTLDSFYTSAPETVPVGSIGGFGAMPTEEIEACLEAFFKS